MFIPFVFTLVSHQTAQQQLSKKEIEDLLRRGAYGAIMDEEDEGAKFCEEDIDQILQRRTKTITIESEGRGSTFAKVRGRLYDPAALTTTGGESKMRLRMNVIC